MCLRDPRQLRPGTPTCTRSESVTRSTAAGCAIALAPQSEVRSPILCPATLVCFRADWIQFSPSGREHDLLLGNAHPHQRVVGCLSADIRKSQVVDDVSTLVGVPFDSDKGIR